MLLAFQSLGAAAAESNAVPAAPPASAAAPSSTNAAPAEESGRQPRGADYSSFKIIADRNIFSPSRTSRSGAPSRPAARPAQVDTFSLVGVMSYEKGHFAFFDGSSASYRKALKLNESIAGYQVAAINPASVKLERDGKSLELALGSQMKRSDEGPWEMQAAPAPSSSESSVSRSSGSSAAAKGEDSDVLKRLLQRKRDEENKQ